MKINDENRTYDKHPLNVKILLVSLFQIVLEKKTAIYLIPHGEFQSELLGQFRLIDDRASDVSGGRICLT